MTNPTIPQLLIEKDMALIRVVGWLLLHPTAPEISQVR